MTGAFITCHLLCLLTGRTNNAGFRATGGVVSVKFWNFSVPLPRGGGEVPFCSGGIQTFWCLPLHGFNDLLFAYPRPPPFVLPPALSFTGGWGWGGSLGRHPKFAAGHCETKRKDETTGVPSAATLLLVCMVLASRDPQPRGALCRSKWAD